MYRKTVIISLLSLLAACSTSQKQEENPKNIPVDTGAQPQGNVVVAAPPGTMGHGKF